MADQKRPLDRVLDLFVYAPLGLVMNLEEIVPELIEKGHQQVNMARRFGQFAVQTGTKEARKRVEHVQERVGRRAGPSSDGSYATPSMPPSPSSAPPSEAPADTTTAPAADPAPTAGELALP